MGAGETEAETELLSAATALICYLLHLPLLLALSSPLFIFLLIEGKEQIAAARNLCPDKLGPDLIDLQE